MLENISKQICNKDDELYTPRIIIEPVLKYLDKSKIIWCPFDLESSNYVTILKDNGFSVINSHLETGQDFFQYEPDNYDYIISNPLFSLKLKILERVYKLNKPFMLLLGLPILNYQEIAEFFYNQNSDLQLLIFDKKVSFDGNTSSFATAYYCRGILPTQLIFEHLDHNNSGKYFEGKAMKKTMDLFDFNSD